MTDHAQGRGVSPIVQSEQIEETARVYLQETDGNPSAALRLAVEDLLAIDQFVALIAAGTSWGFLRQQRPNVLRSSAS